MGTLISMLQLKKLWPREINLPKVHSWEVMELGHTLTQSF